MLIVHERLAVVEGLLVVEPNLVLVILLSLLGGLRALDEQNVVQRHFEEVLPAGDVVDGQHFPSQLEMMFTAFR